MRPETLVPEPKRSLVDPLSVMGLRSVFDRFFDDWAGLAPLTPTERRNGGFLPRIDVDESDENVTVTVELPGLQEKDVEVDLGSDFLTVKGEKRAEKTESHEGYHRSERAYGSFRRDISLPCEVQADRTKATFRSGVLTVTLPKAGESKAGVRKIPVQAR